MNFKHTFSALAIFAVVLTTITTPVLAEKSKWGRPSQSEEYFLIRTLENLYEQWPQNVSDPVHFTTAAAELRRSAISLQVRAETAKLHPSLVEGFRDFVRQLDAYTAFLTDIGAIEQNAKIQASEDALRSGGHGGKAAIGSYTVLSGQDNVSSTEALVVSAAFGAVVYAVEYFGSARQREEALRHALHAEAQRIQDTFIITLERTRQRFLNLAISRGWEEEEIGWNLSPEHAQVLLNMHASQDINGLIAETSRQRSLRPDDPYIALQNNLLRSILAVDKPKTLDHLTEDTLTLIRLIPNDSFYNQYMLSVVSAAATFASASRYAERIAGASPRSSSRSRLAVALWEEAYLLNTQDPAGKARFYRAQAYASNGDTRKALSELGEIANLYKNDPDFLYAYAYIYSLAGNYDASLRFLKRALQTNEVDLATIRTDPDLDDLRISRKTDYDKLTTPQFTFSIQYGILFSNVILTNDSPFTLTNVKLVSATAGWNPELEVDVLPSGKTHTWTWVAKPPGGIAIRAKLISDQSEVSISNYWE